MLILIQKYIGLYFQVPLNIRNRITCLAVVKRSPVDISKPEGRDGLGAALGESGDMSEPEECLLVSEILSLLEPAIELVQVPLRIQGLTGKYHP